MPGTEFQCKDSYDQFLEFSQITSENWLLPDRKHYVPFGIGQEEWIAPFLEPRLDKRVPRDLIRVFEMARGPLIYSWFFYPLATLGTEQCTRVAEFAARERCRLLGRESDNFAENLRTLLGAGIISSAEEQRWQALRQLRNDRSHLKGFMLVDPGQAIDMLRTTAELVNSLFVGSASITS